MVPGIPSPLRPRTGPTPAHGSLPARARTLGAGHRESETGVPGAPNGRGRHHRRQRRRPACSPPGLRRWPLYFARRVDHPGPGPRGGPGSPGRDPRRPQASRSSCRPPRDTTVDGVYGFFFDGGRGHARIGRIVSYSPRERTVLREVEAVYSGDLSTARRGWWSGAVYPDPADDRNCRARRSLIPVDGGEAPAWLVRADGTGPRRTPGPSWCTAAAPRGRRACGPCGRPGNWACPAC